MYVPVVEIAKGIFKISPPDSGHTAPPTNPFLVKGKERSLIAEPGLDGQVPAIADAVKACWVDIEKVEYVWLSHIHLYHSQGLSVVLKAFPKAKVLVHPRGAPHLIEPTRLMESTRQIFDVEDPAHPGVKKCYGPYLPVPANRVIATEDNQIIDLGGGKKLQIIHAPGHAPHHQGMLDLQTRALFAGDMAMLDLARERAHWDIRPPLFDLDKFLESLQRYKALNPSMLLSFRRGGVSHDPQQTLQWVEEDHVIIEKICRDGMQKKRSFKEIATDVEKYTIWVGARPEMPEGMEPAEYGLNTLFGMLAYVKKKHPELEMPSDASTKIRRG